MPGAPETARPAGAQTLKAGGTSVADRPPWRLIGAIGGVVLLAAALVVVVMARGGPEGAGGPAAAEAEDEPADDQARAPDPPVEVDDDDGAAEAEAEAARQAALRALRAELDGARMWSQVAEAPGDETIAIIQSRECAQAELVAIVDAAAAALKAAGIATVRCAEPHGQVVFERAL